MASFGFESRQFRLGPSCSDSAPKAPLPWDRSWVDSVMRPIILEQIALDWKRLWFQERVKMLEKQS